MRRVMTLVGYAGMPLTKAPRDMLYMSYSDPGETTWQGALIHIWRRFCSLRPTAATRHYYEELSEQAGEMNDLPFEMGEVFQPVSGIWRGSESQSRCS